MNLYLHEYIYVYVFILITYLAIAVLIIMNIRNKKSALFQKEEDWIQQFINKKEKELSINMPSFSVQKYLILSALLPIVFGLIFWLFVPNKTVGAIISLGTIALPEFATRIMIENKKKKYEEKYVRALKTFASSLRAGLSIQQSIREVEANPFIDRDIKKGFRQIDSDIAVGISVEEAFKTFADNTDSTDARDVSAAISMQNIVGGSEGKVIDTIAINIEERLAVKKKIRSAFAGTDFMVNALDMAPFVVLLIIALFSPDYYEPVNNSQIGLIVLIGLLSFTMLGSVKIRNDIKKTKGLK